MGTPESAVPSLRRLVDDGHEIVSVWTQPDKPAGRGKKLHQSPVKEFAIERNLEIQQPQKIRTPEAKELFASHKADVAVVVAYGKILPAEFLTAPRARLRQRSLLSPAKVSRRRAGELGDRQWRGTDRRHNDEDC